MKRPVRIPVDYGGRYCGDRVFSVSSLSSSMSGVSLPAISRAAASHPARCRWSPWTLVTTANIWPSMWTLTASTTSIRKSTPGSRCPAPTSTTPWSRAQQTTRFTTIMGWIGPHYSGGSIFPSGTTPANLPGPGDGARRPHNRQSQTMFAQVNNFADAAFFCQNQKIRLHSRTRCMNTPSSLPIPTQRASAAVPRLHGPQQFADYSASLGGGHQR